MPEDITADVTGRNVPVTRQTYIRRNQAKRDSDHNVMEGVFHVSPLYLRKTVKM